MNETLKPMDSIRLGYFTSLLAYSYGIIFYVYFKNFFISLTLLYSILLLLPLTLLITDIENIYTEYITTGSIPMFIGVIGVLNGYLIVLTINTEFTEKKFLLVESNNKDEENNNNSDKEDEKEEEINSDKENDYQKYSRIGKSCTIGLLLFIVCAFYIIDLSIPFFVYSKTYLIIRYCCEIGVLLFIIGISLGFNQILNASYWSLVAFSLLSIESTIFFIFNLSDNWYYLYISFIIHVFIVLIIFKLFTLFYKCFKSLFICILSKRNVNNKYRFENEKMEFIDVTQDVKEKKLIDDKDIELV